MRHVPFTLEAVLILVLVVCLPSCVFRKPQTAKAAPPPPAPVAAPKPAPPPEPLSIPQTEVRLPPAQPLTPEAIATTQPPEEPPVSPAPPRPSPSRTRGPGPATRPEAPAQPPAAPPAAEPERPPIQEVLPAAELKRFQDEAQARKREVHQLVDGLDRHRLSRQQRGIFDRIQSFLKQSDTAEQAGDMRQASELAQRALVLAHELKP